MITPIHYYIYFKKILLDQNLLIKSNQTKTYPKQYLIILQIHMIIEIEKNSGNFNFNLSSDIYKFVLRLFRKVLQIFKRIISK